MTDDDRLDPFFDRVRPEPPPELAARIFAGLDDRALARRFRFEELGDLSRRFFWVSAALFLVALTTAVALLASEREPAPLPPHAADAPAGELAYLARPIENQIRSHWLLAEGK
jgi:predicted ATPase